MGFIGFIGFMGFRVVRVYRVRGLGYCRDTTCLMIGGSRVYTTLRTDSCIRSYLNERRRNSKHEVLGGEHYAHSCSGLRD